MKAKYWLLENTTTRNAFYEVICLVDDAPSRSPIVAISYGKRGTEGRTEIKKCESDDKAAALAISLAAGKQAKQYEPVHVEVNVTLNPGGPEQWDIANLVDGKRAIGLRRFIQRKILEGDAVSREQALSYLEGFTSECETFLNLAQDGSFAEDEIRTRYDDLIKKWDDFQDKYEKAESAIALVKMRAMLVQSR